VRKGRATARLAAAGLHGDHRLAGRARLLGERQQPGSVADALEVKHNGAGRLVGNQVLENLGFGNVRLVADRHQLAETDPEIVAAAEHRRHQRAALADDSDRSDRQPLDPHRERGSER
jgi:hypothetical protein